MRTKIVIQNNTLDLTDDIDVSVTYSINDIRDVASKNTSYTKTITIPGTAQNNFIFGSIFKPEVSNLYDPNLPNIGYNFNPALEATCYIYFDNIQVVKGVARLMGVNIINGVPEYEITVIGELGGLAQKIGDKYLTDLDFSAYDHVYNATNIGATWDQAGGSGYHYPLIDYGYNKIGKDFAIQNLRPAFYVKEYLDKIIAAAGYTYEFDYSYIPNYLKLIVPFNGQYLGQVATYALNVSGSASQTFNNLVFNTRATFPTQTGTQYFTITNNNTFTWNREDPITAQFKITATSTVTAGKKRYYALFKNGVEVQRFEGSSGAGSVTETVTGQITLNKGDYLTVTFGSSLVGSITVTNRSFQVYSDKGLQIPINIGETVIANNAIPKNVKQKDFLIGILQMFNIYITEDKLKNKHLIFTPFMTFYNGNSVDWTYKLDYSKPIQIKPLSELTARSFEFKYKDDVDYYNDVYKKKFGYTYGTRTYDTGLDFVKDNKKVELPFSASPMYKPVGDDKVVVGIFKSNGTTLERTASNLRILYTKYLTCDQYTLKNGTTVVSTTNIWPYAGHLSNPSGEGVDLNWGAPQELYFNPSSGSYPTNNLYNDYWSFFIGEISDKDSKLLTAYFKLSLLDVYGVDFGTFIYVNGSCYRLNKIIDYDPISGDVVKCELLKVIDKE